MPSSRSEWDAKHRLAEAPAAEPASIVRELLPLLPTGEALDIACGTGRHALFLTARGQHVTAVDFSSVALDTLELRARSTHTPVRRSRVVRAAGRHLRGGLELIQANLEEMQLPERRFDLIICIRYLQRSLFPQIVRALRPDGVLLMETFTRAQLEFTCGPRNSPSLLETGELPEPFPSLCVLFYCHFRAGLGIANLRAQKPNKRE